MELLARSELKVKVVGWRTGIKVRLRGFAWTTAPSYSNRNLVTVICVSNINNFEYVSAFLIGCDLRCSLTKFVYSYTIAVG